MLDRSLQRLILIKLADCYPSMMAPAALGFTGDDRQPMVNMAYLHEHNLVNAKLQTMLAGTVGFAGASITAKGLDFLQDDGGLSSILNTVTVRFDADTLKALLAARIESGPLPEAEKSKLRKWLEEASGDALREGFTRLVKAALDKAPEAIKAVTDLLD